MVPADWTNGNGTGLFSDPLNWNPSAFPNNGGGTNYTATINTGNSITDNVSLDASATVNSLTLGSSATLATANTAPGLTLGDASAGGTVLTNGGTINFNQGSTLTLELSALGATAVNSSGGNINITNSSVLQLNNTNAGASTLTNDGNIRLGDALTPATLSLNDGGTGSTFTLSGAGTLTLSDNAGNSISGLFGTELLINDTNHAIQGAGAIGNLSFTNNGTLSATGTNALVIDTAASFAFTNGGGMFVNDGSALTFQNTSPGGCGCQNLLTNNGTISVGGTGAGGTLSFNDGGAGNTFVLTGSGSVTLSGGPATNISGVSGAESLVIDTNQSVSGGGTISNFANFTNKGTLTASGNLVIDKGSIGRVTNSTSGNINVNDGWTLLIKDTNSASSTTSKIRNDGNINVGGTGAGGTLAFNDGGLGKTFVLTGSGNIYLSGANSSIVGITGDEKLTIGPSQWVQGTGTIASSIAGLTNNGTIEANGSLVVNATLLNFDATTHTLTSGQYFADTNSTLQLSGVNSIQTVYNAGVGVQAGGLITGNGTTNALANLTNIVASGSGGGVFGGVGFAGAVFRGATQTITPVGGVFTNKATLVDGGAGQAIAEFLVREGANVTVQGNVVNTSTDTMTSTAGFTEALVTVDGTGSQLTVNGNFANSQSSTLPGADFATVTLSNGGNLTINGTFTQTGDGATLEIGNGSTLTATAVDLEGGWLVGTGTIVGDLINNNGVINPGDPGTLTVEGDFSQGQNGLLILDFSSGDPATGFDNLSITGNANVDGTLEVDLLNGFTPTLGETFVILNFAGTLSGDFATLNFPTFNGLTFEEIINGHDITLVVTDAATPEPATFAPAIAGLLALGYAARRKRKRSCSR